MDAKRVRQDADVLISHGALCWHWRLTEMPAGAKGLEVSVCSRPALADVNGYFLHNDEKHAESRTLRPHPAIFAAMGAELFK